MMLGFNLGSGQRRFTSTPEVRWINVDCVSRPPDQVPDLIHDITQPLPFDAGSADFVVLHHVVEHFHCGEADGIVREAHRVLKPRGSLIVCVPCLRALALGRISGRIDNYLLKVNLYGAYQGQPGDDHHWGWWDADDLGEWLGPLGPWGVVRSFDWRLIPGADIARDFWILAMEAVK